MGRSQHLVNCLARNVLLLLILTSFSGRVVLADPLFPNLLPEVGDGPVSVAVGDFNADGRQDLAVTNFNSHDVSVLLGLGDGTFGLESRFGVGRTPTSVAVGDFNADGVQDLAVANSGFPGDVSILLGLGDGTFGPQSRFGAGDAPRSVAVGDFNADGVQDLAVANFGRIFGIPEDVSVLLGLGDGTFGLESRFTVGAGPSSVAVGDFNADGRQDLAVANNGSNDVSVLLGLGDGTFGPESRFGTGRSPISLAVGDFNADGRQDLAVVNFGAPRFFIPGDISILLGLGDGTFVPQSRFRAGFNPRSLAVGDFNADGVQDLAVANANSHDVSVLLGLGDGTFGLESRFGAGARPSSVAVGDFNADGVQDLAVANAGSDNVAILLGLGNGTFGALSLRVGDRPHSVAVGDFNADGVEDLAVANRDSNDVSILLGLGDGTFGPQARFGTGDAFSVAVGDFNADGVQDLAVANANSHDVSVLLGLGDGSFGSQNRFGAGARRFSVAVGDFNADGVQDLAVTDAPTTINLPGAVSVLLGLGDGTFGPQSRFGVGRFPFSVAVGDFNADGVEDLAVANAASAVVSVLLGLGDGSFGPENRFGVGITPVSVAVGDFDGDRVQDLVVAHLSVGPTVSRDVSVLLGLGDGTFGPENRFGVGTVPSSVAVGDFNADGVQDLAVANADSHDVSVLRGLGDGTFGPQSRFGVGVSPVSVAVGDFNADGRQDLAVANDRSGDVSILLNQGPFPNQPPVAMASADAAAECTSPAGALVVLDGSASADPDSSPGTNDDIVSFEWFRDFELATQRNLGVGEILPVTLPLGTHSVTLRVVDSQGEVDTDTILINVVDTRPPDISATLTPSLLWPPNHRMVDIEALVSASDLCSTPALLLSLVSSSERDDAEGIGDGKTVNDIQGAEIGSADFQFQLRAERAGTGEGRTYSVTYLATDASGNMSTAAAFALVPHDVDGVTEPLMITTFESGAGTVNLWTEVPEALYYNVMRGEVSNLREFEVSFHLGQLTCIASSTTQTSTLGSEDRELPPLGEAFFYLVEYNDGRPSGYGTESAAKERFAPPGQSSCP